MSSSNMAPNTTRPDVFVMLLPVMVLLTISVAASTAWISDWKEFLWDLFMSPGILKRIMIAMFVLVNWKNMPFAWTFRVFYHISHNIYIRRRPRLGPRALFRPIISTTYTSVFEIDYNLHKSNSTFFTDIDVSRAHLVTYLLRPAMMNLVHNTSSHFILDPKTDSDPVDGWEKKVQATAISKYVFKLGRLTVHPARILDNSGLLPERPGGWTEGGEEQLDDVSIDLSDTVDREWDWRRVEVQRRKGMKIAARFHAVDEAKGLFDGGEDGVLACSELN
ncbi:hypothetical protein CEP53_001315 [Fusarium sp. AF-6]|nr:hypothetical protein CEP53_001315 [Fusarium sp. AF-6]